MHRFSAILGVIVIVVAGCAGAASPAGTSTAKDVPSTATPGASTAPPAPSTHVSASGAPSPSVAVMELPQAGTDKGGVVFPGTYMTQFTPRLILTVGSEVELSCAPGYKCRGDVDVNLPGWLNLGFGDNPGYEVHFFRLDAVIDPSHPMKLIKPPLDLARWVATVPGITVSGRPKSVQVGGIDATQLDVQSGDKGVSFAPIPGVKEPGIGFSAHQAHRIIVVNVRGQAVMIMVGLVTEDPAAVVTPADLQDATNALQPLIDSVVWQ